MRYDRDIDFGYLSLPLDEFNREDFYPVIKKHICFGGGGSSGGYGTPQALFAGTMGSGGGGWGGSAPVGPAPAPWTPAWTSYASGYYQSGGRSGQLGSIAAGASSGGEKQVSQPSISVAGVETALNPFTGSLATQPDVAATGSAISSPQGTLGGLQGIVSPKVGEGLYSPLGQIIPPVGLYGKLSEAEKQSIVGYVRGYGVPTGINPVSGEFTYGGTIESNVPAGTPYSQVLYNIMTNNGQAYPGSETLKNMLTKAQVQASHLTDEKGKVIGESSPRYTVAILESNLASYKAGESMNEGLTTESKHQAVENVRLNKQDGGNRPTTQVGVLTQWGYANAAMTLAKSQSGGTFDYRLEGTDERSLNFYTKKEADEFATKVSAEYEELNSKNPPANNEQKSINAYKAYESVKAQYIDAVNRDTGFAKGNAIANKLGLGTSQVFKGSVNPEVQSTGFLELINAGGADQAYTFLNPKSQIAELVVWGPLTDNKVMSYSEFTDRQSAGMGVNQKYINSAVVRAEEGRKLANASAITIGDRNDDMNDMQYIIKQYTKDGVTNYGGVYTAFERYLADTSSGKSPDWNKILVGAVRSVEKELGYRERSGVYEGVFRTSRFITDANPFAMSLVRMTIEKDGVKVDVFDDGKGTKLIKSYEMPFREQGISNIDRMVSEGKLKLITTVQAEGTTKQLTPQIVSKGNMSYDITSKTLIDKRSNEKFTVISIDKGIVTIKPLNKDPVQLNPNGFKWERDAISLIVSNAPKATKPITINIPLKPEVGFFEPSPVYGEVLYPSIKVGKAKDLGGPDIDKEGAYFKGIGTVDFGGADGKKEVTVEYFVVKGTGDRIESLWWREPNTKWYEGDYVYKPNTREVSTVLCSGRTCQLHEDDLKAGINYIVDKGWRNWEGIAPTPTPTAQLSPTVSENITQPATPQITPKNILKGLTPLSSAEKTGRNIKESVESMAILAKLPSTDINWKSAVMNLYNYYTDKETGKTDYIKVYNDIVRLGIPLMPPSIPAPTPVSATAKMPELVLNVQQSTEKWKPIVQDTLNKVASGDKSGGVLALYDVIKKHTGSTGEVNYYGIEQDNTLRAREAKRQAYVPPKYVTGQVSKGAFYTGERELTPLEKQELSINAELTEAKRKQAIENATPKSVEIPVADKLNDYERLLLSRAELHKDKTPRMIGGVKVEYNLYGLGEEMKTLLRDTAKYLQPLPKQEILSPQLVKSPDVIGVITGVAKPVIDNAVKVVSDYDLDKKKRVPTDSEIYYAKLAKQYKGDTGEVNYYSVFEKARIENKYPIDLEKASVLGAVTEDLSKYPRLTPEQMVIPSEPTLPTPIQLIRGETLKPKPAIEKLIGKTQMYAEPSEVEVGKGEMRAATAEEIVEARREGVIKPPFVEWVQVPSLKIERVLEKEPLRLKEGVEEKTRLYKAASTLVEPVRPNAFKRGDWYIYTQSENARTKYNKDKEYVNSLIKEGKVVADGTFVGMDTNNNPIFWNEQRFGIKFDELPKQYRDILSTEGYESFQLRRQIDSYNQYTAERNLTNYIVGVDKSGQRKYDVDSIIRDYNEKMGGYSDKRMAIQSLGFSEQDEKELIALIRPDEMPPLSQILSIPVDEWAKYGVRDAAEYFYLHSGDPNSYRQFIEFIDNFSKRLSPSYEKHDLDRFTKNEFWVDPQISHGLVFDYDLGKKLDIASSKGVLQYNASFMPVISEQLNRDIKLIDFDYSNMDNPIMYTNTGEPITTRELLMGATVLNHNPQSLIARLLANTDTTLIKDVANKYEGWWSNNDISGLIEKRKEEVGDKLKNLVDTEQTYKDDLIKRGVAESKADAMGKQFYAMNQATYQLYDGIDALAGMAYGLYSFIFGTIPSVTIKTTANMLSGRPSEAVRDVFTVAKDVALFPLHLWSSGASNISTGRVGRVIGDVLGVAYMRHYSPENIPRVVKAGISKVVPGVSGKDLQFSPKLSAIVADPSKVTRETMLDLWNQAQDIHMIEVAKDLGYVVNTKYDEYGKPIYEIGGRKIPLKISFKDRLRDAVYNTLNSNNPSRVVDEYGKPIKIGGRKDVVVSDPVATIEHRIGAEQRLSGVAPKLNHVSRTDWMAQVADLGNGMKGIVIDSKGEKWGGLFGSQNARDVMFSLRGPENLWPENANNLAIIFSPRDHMDLAKLYPEIDKALKSGDEKKAAEIVVELNSKGLIPEGVYNAFKIWRRPEDENWIPDGMTLYLIPKAQIPWYANMIKDAPTATTKFEAPSRIDAEGKSIREGNWINEYWVMTRKALEDNLTMPTTQERYAQEYLGTLDAIRKHLPWNTKWFPTIEWNPPIRGEGVPTRLPTIAERPVRSNYNDDVEIVLPDGTPSLVVRQSEPMPKKWLSKIVRGEKLAKDEWWGERPKGMRSWVSVYLVDRVNGLIYMIRRKSEPYEDQVYSDWAMPIDSFLPQSPKRMGNTFENQAWNIANRVAGVEGDNVVALGPYVGKIRIEAQDGSRVFVVELKPNEVPKINPKEFPDIIDMKAWKPSDTKDKMIVPPPIYEQLKAINVIMPDLGIDMNRVSEYTGSRKFNISPLTETLDYAFAERVKNKLQPTEAEITEIGLKRRGVRKALEQVGIPVQLTVTPSLEVIGAVKQPTGMININPANIFNSTTIDKLRKEQDRKFLGQVMHGQGALKLTFVGDLHGTYNNLLRDLNERGKLIEGKPDDLSTWHWVGGNRTLVQLGDIRDRGANARELEITFNKLTDEARQQGGDVVRILGNHDLAYLRGEKISGIKYTRAGIQQARAEILDDINKGYVKPAASVYGILVTHAGVSTNKFPEWKGKNSEEIVADINNRFYQALYSGDNKALWTDPIFHLGSAEKGKVNYPTYDEGGIFWFRPYETRDIRNMWLDEGGLNYTQIMGHTPDPYGRIQHLYTDDLGNSRIIMVDIGRDYWTREKKINNKPADPKAGSVLHMEINNKTPLNVTAKQIGKVGGVGVVSKVPQKREVVSEVGGGVIAEEIIPRYETKGKKIIEQYRGRELPISGREELFRLRGEGRVSAEERARIMERGRESTEERREPREERREERAYARPEVRVEEAREELRRPEEEVRIERVNREEQRREDERRTESRREARESRAERAGRYDETRRIDTMSQRGIVIPPRVAVVSRTKPIRPAEVLSRFKNKKGEYEGLIAWKQGWAFRVWYPPFSQKSMLVTRRPVEGVEYHTGLRSAYDSIVRRGGYIPPVLSRKMGVFGVQVFTPKDVRKPELRFRREPEKVYRGKRKMLSKLPTMVRMIRL